MERKPDWWEMDSCTFFKFHIKNRQANKVGRRGQLSAFRTNSVPRLGPSHTRKIFPGSGVQLFPMLGYHREC